MILTTKHRSDGLVEAYKLIQQALNQYAKDPAFIHAVDGTLALHLSISDTAGMARIEFVDQLGNICGATLFEVN